jgi:hypothetical protein
VFVADANVLLDTLLMMGFARGTRPFRLGQSVAKSFFATVSFDVGSAIALMVSREIEVSGDGGPRFELAGKRLMIRSQWRGDGESVFAANQLEADFRNKDGKVAQIRDLYTSHRFANITSRSKESVLCAHD